MRGSRFFDGVAQVKLALAAGDVQLPIFYYDGAAIGAVFPARLAALRGVLPDPDLTPARLAPGVGAIAITCFEYRDTDIGPYNELAVSILVDGPGTGPKLPGLALLSELRHRRLNAFVWHLPVTTEIARQSGVDLYNYPKFVGDIAFEDTETGRSCRLYENGEHILTLSGARIATPRAERVRLFSHLWMDRQPQSSEFAINALQLGISSRRSAGELTLGAHHPIARELRRVLLSHRPVQWQYLPAFEGVLYGPEHLTAPLLRRLDRLTPKEQPSELPTSELQPSELQASELPGAQPAGVL